jgi:hypothetical protein
MRLPAFFLSCLLPALALAQPRLDAVVPVAVQQGQVVDLTLTGAQLAGPHTLLTYRDGLEVIALQPVDGNRVVAKCRIADDCQAGPLAIRLCGQSGISSLRIITVAPLTIVEEKEPNDATRPQTVLPPATIVGTITNEDTDVFTFEAEAGTRISAELEGVRLGYQFYDACLELLGPDGRTRVFADDSPLTRQDPWLSILAPTGGRYMLLVRDRSLDGSDRCRYALHIGSFPRPSLAFPGGGRPTETVAIHFPTEPTLPLRDVLLPENATDRFPWFYRDESGSAPSPFTLQVTSQPNFLEQEPNQPRQQANRLTLPSAICGVIDSPADRDLFRFSAKGGEVWSFRSVSRSLMRSRIDLVLRLHEAEGRYLTSNDDNGGPDSYVEYTIPSDGEYLLEVVDHLGRGGPDYAYRVVADRPSAATTVTLPPRAVNASTTVTVPQNNRMAVLVAVTRQRHDAPVEFQWSGLPSGVDVNAPQLESSRDRVPIVFQAKPTAAIGGTLISLQGESHIGDVNVTASFNQRTPLAIGENNRDMWGHDADRVALAVNPPAPFHLELDPQADPLIRNGEKQLTVRVTRQEGHRAAVNVQALYNPPGLSSTGNLVITEVQEEGTLVITANGSAPLGNWPVVVLGQSTIAGVRHEVSSNLITLRVEDVRFDVTIQKARIKRGAETAMAVDISHRTDVAFPVQVQLVGLPPGVSASSVQLESGQARVLFPLVAEAGARPGSYRSILCRFRSEGVSGPIVETLGAGQLRVDP